MYQEIRLSEQDRITMAKLEERGGYLSSMMDICYAGCIVSHVILAVTFICCIKGTQLPLSNKIVIGLIALSQPWMLWAVEFMPIPVGFEVDRALLLVSGIHLATRIIYGYTSYMLEKTVSLMRELLEKCEE